MVATGNLRVLRVDTEVFKRGGPLPLLTCPYLFVYLQTKEPVELFAPGQCVVCGEFEKRVSVSTQGLRAGLTLVVGRLLRETLWYSCGFAMELLMWQREVLGFWGRELT